METLKAQIQKLDADRVRGAGKKVAILVATRGLIKAVPVLGPAVAAFAGYTNVRKKGWIRGGVDTALDLTPMVGRAKAVFEFFRGDLIDPPAERIRSS